ncbi:hypothetical protein TNCV_1239031 [Trichonephila clavipes]|nr:hypothetical protein TNCV_1239031 [Trichonephila clavipes]
MPSCHSVHDLELAVQDFWAHLPQDNIRCLINSMPVWWHALQLEVVQRAIEVAQKSKSSYSPNKSNTRKTSKYGHQTEEELVLLNEQTRQKMTQIFDEEAAEQLAARLDDAGF